MNRKSKAFEKFKDLKDLVENEIDLKIKCLRNYRGGEFTSYEFNDFCEYHGIRRHFILARNPQHNGVVERKNLIFQDITKSLVFEAQVPD